MAKEKYGSRTLRQYFKEIGDQEPLSSEEEIEVVKKVKKGNSEALDKLLKANLRFVVTVAKKYQGNNLPLEDLINEGNLGLIKAAKKFDETKGFKFISYAVWWIRQSIMKAISDYSRMIRLPMNVITDINKISRISAQFSREFEREPTAKELREMMEQENIKTATLKHYNNRAKSIDEPIDENGDKTLKDVLPNQNTQPPARHQYEQSFSQEIDNALDMLDSRERKIIKQYFGIGRERPATLEEVGETFALTRERIRQIKERALRKLRQASMISNLENYL